MWTIDLVVKGLKTVLKRADLQACFLNDLIEMLTLIIQWLKEFNCLKCI